MGTVQRTCDRGGCTENAVLVGSFTDRLGVKSTQAACGAQHQADVTAQLGLEGYQVAWNGLVGPKTGIPGAAPAKPSWQELWARGGVIVDPGRNLQI